MQLTVQMSKKSISELYGDTNARCSVRSTHCTCARQGLLSLLEAHSKLCLSKLLHDVDLSGHPVGNVPLSQLLVVKWQRTCASSADEALTGSTASL